METLAEQWKVERDEALRNWKDCERELAIVREANLGLARKVAELEAERPTIRPNPTPTAPSPTTQANS